MTEAQTIAEALVAAGAPTHTEAHRSPLRNVLASALGGRPAKPMTLVTEGRWDDVTLLCRRPHEARHDDEIRDHLVHTRSAEQTWRDLVARALERGGEDNVTVVIRRLRRRPGKVPEG
jgi:serine/threonine protein phosphatase PrpC